MAGKKILDSIIIVAGGVEMVLGAMTAAFPTYVPAWLAWLCLGVGAATLVYGFYRIRQEAWEWVLERARAELSSKQAGTRSEWEQEWHESRLDRREFLRLLETTYANWSMKPNPERSLMEVARAANFPQDLPLSDGNKFPDWAWEAEKHCSGDAGQLLRFASEIYMAVTPPRVVKSQLMGSAEFDKFDDIRMALAKFWDHWGRQEPLEHVIREQKADGIVKSHASEIKLLTFLEVARVRWAKSDVPGKSGLFRLGRRNAETGAS